MLLAGQRLVADQGKISSGMVGMATWCALASAGVMPDPADLHARCVSVGATTPPLANVALPSKLRRIVLVS